MLDQVPGAAPVALVTRAGRRIGFEVCRQLAAPGMTMLLTARDGDTAAGSRAAGWHCVVKPGGTVVLVNPGYALPPLKWLLRLSRRQRLRSVLVQPGGADLETIGGGSAEGAVCPLIDRTDPLADAAAAQRHSETGHVRGKMVLVVDEQLAHLRREDEAVQVFASASMELAGAGEPRDASPVASEHV